MTNLHHLTAWSNHTSILYFILFQQKINFEKRRSVVPLFFLLNSHVRRDHSYFFLLDSIYFVRGTGKYQRCMVRCLGAAVVDFIARVVEFEDKTNVIIIVSQLMQILGQTPFRPSKISSHTPTV